MTDIIIPIFLGVFISILGVCNMKGNISSIHWYHRHRVSEENIIPFGKLVGLGTVIIGISLAFFGILSYTAKVLEIDLFITIGSILVIVGIAVGLGVSLYAMIKYNKGIF